MRDGGFSSHGALGRGLTYARWHEEVRTDRISDVPVPATVASRLVLATVGVALALLQGCGDAVLRVPGAPQRLLPADPAHYQPMARLLCGTFPLSGLDSPTGAQNEHGPEFDALRRAVSSSREGYGDDTWRFVQRTPNRAVFVAQLENAWACIVVGPQGDEWTTLEESETAELDIVLSDELGAARWKPASGKPPPDATQLDVLVSEQECASGSYATGRIAPPLVEYRPETLTVTFGIRRFRSLLGGITCQSNPWTPAILTLPEPIGDRTLLDGSVYPPTLATANP